MVSSQTTLMLPQNLVCTKTRAPRPHLKSAVTLISCDSQQFEVLLLVGAGIGVTPFASVLADLVNRMEAERAYAASGQVTTDLARETIGQIAWFHDKIQLSFPLGLSSPCNGRPACTATVAPETARQADEPHELLGTDILFELQALSPT